MRSSIIYSFALAALSSSVVAGPIDSRQLNSLQQSNDIQLLNLGTISGEGKSDEATPTLTSGENAIIPGKPQLTTLAPKAGNGTESAGKGEGKASAESEAAALKKTKGTAAASGVRPPKAGGSGVAAGTGKAAGKGEGSKGVAKSTGASVESPAKESKLSAAQVTKTKVVPPSTVFSTVTETISNSTATPTSLEKPKATSPARGGKSASKESVASSPESTSQPEVNALATEAKLATALDPQQGEGMKGGVGGVLTRAAIQGADQTALPASNKTTEATPAGEAKSAVSIIEVPRSGSTNPAAAGNGNGNGNGNNGGSRNGGTGGTGGVVVTSTTITQVIVIQLTSPGGKKETKTMTMAAGAPVPSLGAGGQIISNTTVGEPPKSGKGGNGAAQPPPANSGSTLQSPPPSNGENGSAGSSPSPTAANATPETDEEKQEEETIASFLAAQKASPTAAASEKRFLTMRNGREGMVRRRERLARGMSLAV